jgi:energy-coupling factor transporter ATP-binding protein EcfA2
MATRFKLEGVHVLGPAPIVDVYVRLQSGLTAIYGANGAGKTRLMDAVARILRGERHGHGYVVASLNLEEMDAEYDPDDTIEMALWGWSWLKSNSDAPQDSFQTLVRDVLTSIFERSQDSRHQMDASTAEAVVRQSKWILYPAGTPGAPRWIAVPGIKRDELSSDVNAALDQALVVTRSFGVLDREGVIEARSGLTHPIVASGPLRLRHLSEDALGNLAARLDRSADVPFPVLSAEVDGMTFEGPIADVLVDSDLTELSLASKTMDFAKSRLQKNLLDEDDHVVPRYSVPRRRLLGAGNGPAGLEELRKLAVEAPEFWFDCDPFRWTAIDSSGLELNVSDLSAAQTRWSCLAASIAITKNEREFAISEQRRKLISYHESDISDEELLDPDEIEDLEIEDLESEDDDLEDDDLENDDLELEDFEENDPRTWFGGPGSSAGATTQFDYAPLDPEDPDLVVEDPTRREEYIDFGFIVKESDAEIRPGPDEKREPLRRNRLEIATDRALRQARQLPLFILIDEPEKGLHRTAERQTAKMLRNLAKEQSVPIFVATHSPEFLGDPGIRPVLAIRKEPTFRTTLEWDVERIFDSFGDLGIDVADRVHLSRAVLVVEGHHDELVFRELFPEAIARSRVLVLPMHGGRFIANTPDSFFLVERLNCPIVVLVDNAETIRLERVRDDLMAVDPTKQSQLEYVLDKWLKSKSAEDNFMRQLLRRATETGVLGRIHPRGLRKLDVLEYLPVNAFVPSGRSWDELRDEFAKQQKNKNFKSWLGQNHQAVFDDAAIVAACRAMDHLPDDLTMVIDGLRSLAAE